MADAIAKRKLGRTPLEVTAIGLGCWQLSSGTGKGTRGYWAPVSQEDADRIVKAALDGGISWFDTAEMYGGGRSEEALAAALKAAGCNPGDVVVATKWSPIFRTAHGILQSIDERLRHLGGFPVDLYQVHAPWGFSSVAAEMAKFCDLYETGKIRAIGVSNFGPSRMRRAAAALARRKLVLATNQVEYSLLNRRIERDGTLAAAKELGVSIIAYSPLAQGILTGRFHDQPETLRSAGVRRFRSAFRKGALERARPVVEALKEIAAAHGATPTQAALAWTVQFHGECVVAIPGASKPAQVADLTGALRLALRPAELERLDQVSRPFM